MFLKKHNKKILCGFLCCVFCSIFTFNCFATNITYRSYSDLTSTNSTYIALSEMASEIVETNSTLTLALRTETETHLLVLDSHAIEDIVYHGSYLEIPAYSVLMDYYYLNSVPVGYGNNTRYFYKMLGNDYSEDDTFRLYVNHTTVGSIDWGFDTPTFVDKNFDMVHFTYMFLAIFILLVFIIIMRMR